MRGREVIIKDSRFNQNQRAVILEDCKLMDMWLVNLYQEDNKTPDQYNVAYLHKDKVQIIKTDKELQDEKRIKEYEDMIKLYESNIREIKKDIERIKNSKSRIIVLE